MPELQVRDAGFSYGREAYRMEHWTQSFVPGAVTAMVGPSGCGKSTRMYLLGLLLKLNSGQIWWGEQRLDSLSDDLKSALRARSFGFVFQDAALDAHRSVLDNITESALYSGLERIEAQRRARELVEQFDVRVPLHRRPGQISGGQAQRIALCRGLLNRPPIVLADEPTGNLDPASANVVLDALAEHARGGALVIIVTHDNLVRERADLIVDLASQPTVTE